ncbi:MAG: class I SAM-dependent methyltransferase, partial [Thiotrichales bacterium]|nr:class I SAM-dependent methyltransferase [Thiotrichales bacterium]
MSRVSRRAIDWTESGLIPDAVIRRGIRGLLRQRLDGIQADDNEYADKVQRSFVTAMDRSPIALVPGLANEQHYELPASFFEKVLGPHRKYSCCYWPDFVQTLDDAEEMA